MYLLVVFFLFISKGKLRLYLFFSLFDSENILGARNTLLPSPLFWLSSILSLKKKTYNQFLVLCMLLFGLKIGEVQMQHKDISNFGEEIAD